MVEAPLEKTFASLREWNGSRHSDLKVYLHGDLSGSPSPAAFQKLGAAPANPAVKAFVANTQKGDIQVTPAELEQAPKKGDGGGAVPAPVVSFWGTVLSKRGQAYLGGGLPAQPAYSVGGQQISPAAEASALLKAMPKIAAQFRSTLNAAGVNGKPSKPDLYWELFNAEGTGVVTLGAVAGSGGGKSAQEADVQYYASGDLYALITVQQLWPWQGGGKTLVWRGDLISSGSLGELRGIERNAAGSAMSKEIQRVIQHFQKDISR